MNILKSTILCAVVTSALQLAQPALAALPSPTVVYDNSSNFTGVFVPGTIEVGDQIILAGADRIITEFSLQYSGLNFSGSEKMQVRFYANDGALFNGFAAPGTLLFDSGKFGIAPPSGGETLIFDDFGSWDGLVPNTFTWSVQFSDLGLNADGRISMFNPPTVGNNFDDYWENTGGSWILKHQEGNPINFGATVQAVPEPSTIALGLIGGVVCLIAYRRQRF